MTESKDQQVGVESRTKARKAIIAALESAPVTTEDGERGLYVEILGVGTDISLRDFKRALGSLVFSDNRTCRLAKDRNGVGQSTGRMTLTLVRRAH